MKKILFFLPIMILVPIVFIAVFWNVIRNEHQAGPAKSYVDDSGVVWTVFSDHEVSSGQIMIVRNHASKVVLQKIDVESKLDSSDQFISASNPILDKSVALLYFVASFGDAGRNGPANSIYEYDLNKKTARFLSEGLNTSVIGLSPDETYLLYTDGAAIGICTTKETVDAIELHTGKIININPYPDVEDTTKQSEAFKNIQWVDAHTIRLERYFSSCDGTQSPSEIWQYNLKTNEYKMMR